MLRITFDGPDMVGKTTLINSLARVLEEAWHRVVIFREPYDWFPYYQWGNKDVEKMQHNIRGRVFEKSDEFVLYAKYRNVLYNELSNRLSDSVVVLQDRSVVSTLIYNVAKEDRSFCLDYCADLFGDLCVLIGPKSIFQRSSSEVDEIDNDVEKQMAVAEALSEVSFALAQANGTRFLFCATPEDAYTGVLTYLLGRRNHAPAAYSPNFGPPPPNTSAREVLPELYAAGR